MNFGKYLVDNSAVEKEGFIQAVIKQLESRPSTLSAVVELNLLDVDKLLEVIFLSLDSGNDILSSMKQLGVSDEILAKIDEFQSVHTKNLIDLLVNEKYAEKSQVLELYEKYQKEDFSNTATEVESDIPSDNSASGEGDSLISAAALESLKELQGGDIDMSQFEEMGIDEVTVERVEPVVEVEKNEEVSDTSDVEISSAALESLKELGGVSDEELAALTKVTENIAEANESILEPQAQDFITIFDEKKNKKINKILSMIKDSAQTDGDIANYFNSLFRELHIVKEAAVLVDAKYSKKLIEIWELIIDKIFTLSTPELKAWYFSYESALQDTADILWEIREDIGSGRSEEEYMKSEESKNKYLTNISLLKKIITELA